MTFSSTVDGKLRQLLRDGLLHFAENAPDVSDPPNSLDETLQLGAETAAAAPFHLALLPEIVRFKMLERSFSSALGAHFEQMAYAIASERFQEAHLQHVVGGEMRATVNGEIEQILKDYETFKDGKRIRTPDVESELEMLRGLTGPGGEAHQETVDLFVLGHDGREHYFHMKTIKPNKDQSHKAKRLMLRVRALRNHVPASVFFSMAYNPYGEGNTYKWSFCKPYLDFEKEVLIGGEFWDYLGGKDTYRQLLQLAIDVGRQAHGEVIGRLGL